MFLFAWKPGPSGSLGVKGCDPCVRGLGLGYAVIPSLLDSTRPGQRVAFPYHYA